MLEGTTSHHQASEAGRFSHKPRLRDVGDTLLFNGHGLHHRMPHAHLYVPVPTMGERTITLGYLLWGRDTQVCGVSCAERPYSTVLPPPLAASSSRAPNNAAAVRSQFTPGAANSANAAMSG